MGVGAFMAPLASPLAARRAVTKASDIEMIFGKKQPAQKKAATKKAAPQQQKGKVVIDKSGTDNSWQAGSFGYTVPGDPPAGNNAVYRLKGALENFDFLPGDSGHRRR